MVNDTCHIQELNQSKRELIIKGSCDYQGVINGTWFQIDNLTNHWISFRWNKFNSWQAFYKCVQGEKITYYRQVFSGIKGIMVFSFSEKDEWIKDPITGKWKSKF